MYFMGNMNHSILENILKYETDNIEWQFKLVTMFTHLNNKAQYFIASLSPALFGEGWGDKVWYMDQITK